MSTNVTKQAREIKVFGETIEEMREAASYNLNDPVLLNSYAQGILSDAQEVLARGDIMTANRWINKAKYFIQESTSLQRMAEK